MSRPLNRLALANVIERRLTLRWWGGRFAGRAVLRGDSTARSASRVDAVASDTHHRKLTTRALRRPAARRLVHTRPPHARRRVDHHRDRRPREPAQVGRITLAGQQAMQSPPSTSPSATPVPAPSTPANRWNGASETSPRPTSTSPSAVKPSRPTPASTPSSPGSACWCPGPDQPRELESSTEPDLSGRAGLPVDGCGRAGTSSRARRSGPPSRVDRRRGRCRAARRRGRRWRWRSGWRPSRSDSSPGVSARR